MPGMVPSPSRKTDATGVNDFSNFLMREDSGAGASQVSGATRGGAKGKST
jgi:hypothetical protein